jgi:uncharacterized protein (TIGR00255 family)
MTGYAETVAEHDGAILKVSLRSVNHRFLDLHVHLPEGLQLLEGKIRREVQEKNPRGRLDLKIIVEGQTQATPRVDEALLGQYVALCERLGRQYGLEEETDLATLFRLPGVLNVTGASVAGDDTAARLEAPLLDVLRQTLQRWDDMRAAEAAFLVEDMAKRLQNIMDAAATLEGRHEEVVLLAQKRLQERLQALAGQSGLDPARLAQEAAVLAERADSTEEILRLKAHTAQFAQTLAQETDVGRKLDFLLQEMHRELNTFMAKTAGLGEGSLSLTDTAIAVKGEVEKLREQVQNLQ